MGCRSAFETNNGPIRFDHERVELIKGIDTPNGKAHFVVARETPINADMRVVFPAMTKCGRGAFLFRTDKQGNSVQPGTNNRSKIRRGADAPESPVRTAASSARGHSPSTQYRQQMPSSS
jgi:hypothetical protein